MTDRDYAIVGSEVDDPRRLLAFADETMPQITDLVGNVLENLHPDDSLAQVLDPGPLTVESVGKLMVELSDNRNMSEQKVENREKLVKASFSFFPIQGNYTDEEKEKLLDAAKVSISFEDRTDVGDTQENTRILVVPADGTLKGKQTVFAHAPIDPKKRPPLSYQLDRFLMLAYLRDEIKGFAGSFFATAEGSQLGAEIQDKLLKHIDKRIDETIYIYDDQGEIKLEDAKNQILLDQIRALHRSVGIYATNMCR